MSDGLPGDGLDTIRDPAPLPVPRSPIDARDIRIGELVVALSRLENLDGAPIVSNYLSDFYIGRDNGINMMAAWVKSIVQPVLNGAKNGRL